MKYYQNSFIQLIEIIDLLLENIISNIGLIPYSLRCICKIMFKLVSKKFIKATKLEISKFVFTFFFQIIFYRLIRDPYQNLFITEYNIPQKVLIDLFADIKRVLNKMITFTLFDNSEFNPFNLYIINTEVKLQKLLDKFCKVKLPKFIEELIDKNFPKDYKYDYFKNNPNEKYLHLNIFFNVPLFANLLKIITEYQHYDEINEQKFDLTINEINEKEDIKEMIKKYKSNNYAIIAELFNEENDKKKRNDMESYITNCKNIFKDLLWRAHPLKETDLDEENFNSLENAIKFIINKNKFFEFENIVEDLSQLPNEEKMNNYQKFLLSIEKGNISINDDEFYSFSQYSIEIDKEKEDYEFIKKICFEQKIKKILDKINIGFSFELIRNNEEKQKLVFNNIKEFINSIPSLNTISQNQKTKTIWDLIKENDYFGQIKNIANKIQSELLKIPQIKGQYDKLIQKMIENYIFDEIYLKIFPKAPSQKDIKIYEFLEKNSSKKLEDFIQKKKIKNSNNLENILLEFIDKVGQFENERSPNKKKEILDQIMKVEKVGKYFDGIDSDFKNDFLNYILTKAKPKMLDTNYKYMETFFGDECAYNQNFGFLESFIVKYKDS